MTRSILRLGTIKWRLVPIPWVFRCDGRRHTPGSDGLTAWRACPRFSQELKGFRPTLADRVDRRTVAFARAARPLSSPMVQRRPEETSEMAFYELRQYKVLPGKMDEWVKIMEEEIIPFQVSKGMTICGSFRGETDDSAYVWLRRFESEAEREALYKAVYDSEYWKTKIAPRVPSCLDRSAIVVTRIVPTPKSTMR
jgi:NIPSNAP